MNPSIQTCPSCGRHVDEDLDGRACSDCRIAEEVVEIISYAILRGARPVIVEYSPPSRTLAVIGVFLAFAVRGAAFISGIM